MKKAIFGLLIGMFFLGGTLLSAQPRGGARDGDLDKDRVIQVYLNLGYTNLFDFPRWMTFGPDVEIRLGKKLTFAPEVSLWFRDFFGHSVSVVPGATLNLKTRSFLVGGGVIRRVPDIPGGGSGVIAPKIQAGYHSNFLKITGILIPLLGDPPFIFGISLGFRL